MVDVIDFVLLSTRCPKYVLQKLGYFTWLRSFNFKPQIL